MNNDFVRTTGASKRRWLMRTGIICGALFATLMGGTQHANADKNDKYYDAFFGQGYGWCDARKLGKAYNTSPGEAKLVAGVKIAGGHLSLVKRSWSKGVRYFQKNGLSCDSSSLMDSSMERYAYNDAEQIARAWKSVKAS